MVDEISRKMSECVGMWQDVAGCGGMWRDVAGCGGDVAGMWRGCVGDVSGMCRGRVGETHLLQLQTAELQRRAAGFFETRPDFFSAAFFTGFRSASSCTDMSCAYSSLRVRLHIMGVTRMLPGSMD